MPLMHRGQRSTHRHGFSHSTVRVPGITRLGGMNLYPVSHLTSPLSDCFKNIIWGAGRDSPEVQSICCSCRRPEFGSSCL